MWTDPLHYDADWTPAQHAAHWAAVRPGDWLCDVHDVVKPGPWEPVPACPACGLPLWLVIASPDGANGKSIVEVWPRHCGGPDRHPWGWAAP